MYEEMSSSVEEEKKKKSVQNCRMHTKGPASRGKTKIPLEYIYRQAVLLRGGSLVPPAKGCKFVERKMKEKKRKKERRKQKTQHLERKRERKEKKSNRKQQRISRGGNKIRKL